MTWVLTIGGLIALVLIHEFGHFAAAKAVGMRVERFMLFIGPPILKFRRGETEYGIAPLPLGGYVKISGMNPHEELPPNVVGRAFYRQPVWKRIVVVLAGPFMNLVLAFAIFWGLFLSHGVAEPTQTVAKGSLRPPASEALRPGDKIVSVDGVRGTPEQVREQISTHRCPGRQTNGCEAATPAVVVIERDGKPMTFHLKPRYDASQCRPLLGFGWGSRMKPVGPLGAAASSLDSMWFITTATMSAGSSAARRP